MTVLLNGIVRENFFERNSEPPRLENDDASCLCKASCLDDDWESLWTDVGGESGS